MVGRAVKYKDYENKISGTMSEKTILKREIVCGCISLSF
jgi:hypothetical protein